MSEPRFLCDEMLRRLGRWLRAAGYDTAIAGAGADDRSLVAQADVEGRLLLTRDRPMSIFHNGSGCIVLLRPNSFKGVVEVLSRRLSIDWLLRPFSRCLECNTPVIPASGLQCARLPEGVRQLANQTQYCPHCDKLYWEGGHVRRMRHTLENFAHGIWMVAED